MPVKVSICLPTYEQPDLTRRCLVSIMDQSYKDYEIIITDDSNSRLVKKVVDEFYGKLPIKYYKNSVRLGSPENWNKAISYSNGEYIKFLHHDDYFCNTQSLEKFVYLLDNNKNISFGFCSSNSVDTHGKKINTHYITDRQLKSLMFNSEVLFFGNFIGGPSSTIFRRPTIKFDRHLKWLVDVDFYIRLLKINSSFIYEKDPLVNVTMNGPSQVTRICENSKDIEVFEYLEVYKKLNKKYFNFLGYLAIFRRLYKKYNINFLSDFPKCIETTSIPWQCKLALLSRKII